MKVYKIEICIIDFDQLGEKEIRDVIKHTRYPNRCITPKIISVEERDIGEWDDDHLLNQKDKFKAEYERLFNKEEE